MMTLIANQGMILKGHMLMLLPEPTLKRTPLNEPDRVIEQDRVPVILHHKYN
jgi:hypothetical protein